MPRLDHPAGHARPSRPRAPSTPTSSAGFIRAEVVRLRGPDGGAGSIAACREKGTLRLEGKEYVVRDGDVINFRFNV